MTADPTPRTPMPISETMRVRKQIELAMLDAGRDGGPPVRLIIRRICLALLDSGLLDRGSGERRSDFDPAATAAPDEASPATAPPSEGVCKCGHLEAQHTGNLVGDYCRAWVGSIRPCGCQHFDAGNAEGGGVPQKASGETGTPAISHATDATVPPRVDGDQFEKAIQEAEECLNNLQYETQRIDVKDPDAERYLGALSVDYKAMRDVLGTLSDQYAGLQRRAEAAEALAANYKADLESEWARNGELRREFGARDREGMREWIARLYADSQELAAALTSRRRWARRSGTIEPTEPARGYQRQVRLSNCDWPIGTEVTVTKRRRAQEGGE